MPNLKSFGPLKAELVAQEVGKFAIMLCGEMGWWTSFTHSWQLLVKISIYGYIGISLYMMSPRKAFEYSTKWKGNFCR